MGRMGTKKVVLLGVWLALLAGLVVGINVMGSRQGGGGQGGATPSQPAPKLDTDKLAAQWPQIVAHAAAPPRGDANARYTIAEFGDFQCPQCGKARPLLETLLKQYPTQVNLIFLHRPFPNLHQWAIPAGQASEIAAAQGKFWPIYDVLYAHQDNLETGFYGDYAAQAGLNKAQFQKAFDAGQGLDQVQASSKLADDLGIQLTPTLLIRDNVAKTLTIYAGMDTQKNAEQHIPYPGADSLVARPPWVK